MVSDMVPMEFLKYAHREEECQDLKGNVQIRKSNVLAELLLELFNTCFQHNMYPSVWNTGVITPIFKKKDPLSQAARLDLNNYRGITITSALYKLFATMLEHRLSKWAERKGLRARGQAGFRRGRSAADHVLVLRQLIDRKRQCIGGKLFCCFVDLANVFDSRGHSCGQGWNQQGLVGACWHQFKQCTMV